MDQITDRKVSRTRLADVARLAGVSPPTASKILNNVPTVSARAATRQRVIDAAAALGYRPNATARALAGAPTKALALMVEDLTRPMHSKTIRGVYSAGLALGYTILIVEDGPEGNESLIELVAGGHVDGVLVASARTDQPLPTDLARYGIPHVFLNRAVEGSGRNITMHLALASELVTELLVQLGHTVIGHIAGPANVETARTRASAFTNAAHSLHIQSHIRYAGFDEQAGALAAEELLDSHKEVSAIYTSSVSQAAGVIHVLNQRGLRVPHDVSVIAYGDMLLAGYLTPPLDTVLMPLEDLGQTAVHALVRQIDGHETQDVIVPASPRLLRRSSVAAAAGSYDAEHPDLETRSATS